ncbi:MAG: DUF1178 family protein [Paracoccaceae bacterium]
MIRYSLKCAKAHEFDSWFQSADAYDALLGAGHVACPMCGSVQVEKLLMAPAVRPARTIDGASGSPNLSQPDTEIEKAMAALRAQVEANSDYVGMNFVTEARKMHEGTVPERSIYGEARPDEAKKLIEDGVPVSPLPFMPRRKSN